MPNGDWGITPLSPGRSGFGAQSRIWAPRSELVDARPLPDADAHGYVITARVPLREFELTLVSLHARAVPLSVPNIEALLARLEPLLIEPFVIAGDFNSCRKAQETWPEGGHLDFFERVEDQYGVLNCYWRQHGKERRTYWPGCREEGVPYQDDHFFVSKDLESALGPCEILRYEPYRGISDHTPLMLELEVM